MAYNFKPSNKTPKRGFYRESEFTPLVDSLRSESQDFTPLTDKYVSFGRNVYDMITPDGMIVKLKYDKTKNALVVTYSDGTVDEIQMTDKYLNGVSYIYNPATKSHVATFVFNDGEKFEVDLNTFRDNLLAELEDKFYTKDQVYNKEEVDDLIENADSLQWIPLG